MPRFELSRASGAPVSDEELISDLRSVASELARDSVPQKIYGAIGKFDYSTVIRRFGSWNAALRAAGLSVSNEVHLSDERLFENLLILWQHYGRQPRRSDLAHPPSTISQSPYARRFGSWTSALESFVDFANAGETSAPDSVIVLPNARTTGREPSLRLRFKVLQRDRFRCRVCGSSPANSAGVELHVDHIRPWSAGGETILANLQTLCSTCNLGKSNLELAEG